MISNFTKSQDTLYNGFLQRPEWKTQGQATQPAGLVIPFHEQA